MSNRDEVIKLAAAAPTDINEHLLYIYDTVVKEKPKIIVELGVKDGESTYALSSAAIDTGAVLISVDHIDYSKSCDWDKWVFIRMDDLDFCHVLKIKIDVLFIDTSHDYKHTIEELSAYRPLMSDKGVMLLHDTNWSEVGKAIDDFFVTSNNWKEDFTKTLNKGVIMNRSNNYGLATIYL